MQFHLTLALELYQELKYLFLYYQHTQISISAPDIITFLPKPLPSDNEILPRASNPVLHPEYLHLLKSAFLVKLTAPNKEFLNVKSAFSYVYIVGNVNYHYILVSKYDIILF